MQQVVIIVGPTSSGKSALAVALARKFGGEVVSVDSRQVYKGLDIGTGKVSKREMRGVPHHLLDVASPKRTMTAHAYAQRAQRALQDILRRGKLPILAGGTGFYADVVAGRILLPSVPANRSLRAKLEKKSASALFAMLKKRNARRARAIDPHNKRRLVRALEIAEEGSTEVGSLYTENRPLYDFLWLGIDMPKEELEKKIYTRLRARLKRGLVAEAVRLRRSGLSHKRMEALGLEYRWLALLLQKRVSKTAFEDGLARDICRYARRQRTYWRRNTDIEWFDPRDARAIEARVRQFLC